MNSQKYYNYIEECISTLVVRTETRAKSNILDLNIFCESFYCGLINIVYGTNFVNANEVKRNNAGFDLIDDNNKKLIQITSNGTKDKILDALKKSDIEKYQGYELTILYIGTNTYNKVVTYNYEYLNDGYKILDKNSLLKDILNRTIEDQKKVCEYIESYFGYEGRGDIAIDIAMEDMEINELEYDDDLVYEHFFSNHVNYLDLSIDEMEEKQDELDGYYTIKIKIENSGNKVIQKINVKLFEIMDSLEVQYGNVFGDTFCSYEKKENIINSVIGIGKTIEVRFDFCNTLDLYERQNYYEIQLCLELDLFISDGSKKSCFISMIMKKVDGDSKDLGGKYTIKYKRIL